MIEAIDGIVAIEPFVARRRVTFADCDPAGVVFAGNFYDFALWAYDLYLDRRLRPLDDSVAAPMKAASLVHHAPLYPGDVVDFEVRPVRVGTTTFTLRVEGRSAGRAVFDADLTFICRAHDVWASRPVPPAYRDMLRRDGAADVQQALQGDGL